jgi:hypothetical protein
VRQAGKPGWFERPLLASRRDLAAACQRAIDDMKRETGL